MHRARVKDVFDSYDMDGSGTMDVHEIKELFDELCIPISSTELLDVMHEIDVNSSGLMEVSRDVFL
jgi:Ca2+-binding EF-hand superfamily protein